MTFRKKGEKEIFSDAASAKITEYIGNKVQLSAVLSKRQ